VLVAIAAAAVVAVTAVFTWWSQPLLRIGGSLSAINPPFYVLGGTVLVATTLFAIAVGVAAGALIRRVVPAMAAALAAFLGPWLLLQQSRYELLPPHRLTFAPNAAPPRPGLGDWTLDAVGIVDRSGNTATYEAMTAACPRREVDGVTSGLLDPECLTASGFRYEYIYQPLERFWPLQAVESGILIAAAAVLLAVAAWWTTRRIT
jgi:hypothetical protein